MPYKDPEKAKAYHKAWCEANKDKILAQKKAYYEANKDEILAQQKARYEANKDKRKVQAKAYYEANKEKIKAYNKAHHEANKDKRNAQQKAYYEVNSAKYIERARFRESLLNKLQKPSWYSSKLVNKIYKECKELNKIAGFIKYHVDHIIPLQGKNVSGLHVQGNLQIILASVNLSKSNKFELDII